MEAVKGRPEQFLSMIESLLYIQVRRHRVFFHDCHKIVQRSIIAVFLLERVDILIETQAGVDFSRRRLGKYRSR